MGFQNGIVTLNHSSHAYYSGQTINGHLSFSLDKGKTINGIYVEAKGFRKFNWTTERRICLFPRLSYTVDHDSYEVCFRRTTFLCGGVNGKYRLQPGQHEFKFDCPIPVYCPPSFEGRHGHIRYYFNIVMLTSGIFSFDKKIIVPFRVQPSKQANSKFPIEFQLDDNWCISVGYSQMPVKLAAGGYGPGQVINLEVVCKNKSNSKIKKVVFPMKKSLASQATQSIAPSDPATCKTNSNVAQIKKGLTPARTTRNWIVEFQVFTKIGGCQSQPIVLGTIPLVGLPTNMLIPLIRPPGGINCSLPFEINQPLTKNSRYNGGSLGFSSNQESALDQVPMGESRGLQPTGPPPSYWCAVSTPVSCVAGNLDGSTEKEPLDSIPKVPSNPTPYDLNCMKSHNEKKGD